MLSYRKLYKKDSMMRIRLFLSLFCLFFIASQAFATEEEQPVAPFPPLEKITPEEAAADVAVSFERLKYRLQEYMNETPLRRKVQYNLELLLANIKRAYAIFSENPRKFLEGVGVKDKELINQIVAFMEENGKNSPWQEMDGFSGRIISCAAPDAFGNVAAGVQLSIPLPAFLTRQEASSPLLSLQKSANITDTKTFTPFPKVFLSSEGKVLGYNGTFILPFTFKAENPALPAKITAALKGTLCSDFQSPCRSISFSAAKDININANAFPTECEAIKDALQKATPLKGFTVTKAVITPDNELKIEAESPKEPHNPSLLVLSPKDLKLSTPAIAYTDNKIIVIAKPNKPAPNLIGEKIRIILGSPYTFTEADIIPSKEEAKSYNPSSRIGKAFLSGVLLVFFSPIAILLLFLLLSGEKKQAFRQAATETGITVAILYPLLKWLTPFSWGEQFMQPDMMFFSISLLLLSTSALIRFKGFIGAGIVFALLALLTPCHYLHDLINHGSILAFAITGITSAAIFTVFAKLAQKLPPLPIASGTIFTPAVILSLWLMAIIMNETSPWWRFAIASAGLFFAFGSLYQAFGKEDYKAFPTAILFLFIGFMALPATPAEVKNDFTQTKLEDALKAGKTVYLYTDTPWCLSCKIGKTLLSYDPIFSSLKKEEKLAVFATSWNNPDLSKYRNLFKAANPPLNLIFGEKAHSGIQVPNIMIDSETAAFMKKIR